MKSNLIGGDWLAADSAAPNVNPSDTRDIIDDYALGGASDVASAVDAAVRASASWRQATVQARADILDRVGTEILNRRDELGALLAREEGKTLPEAVGEVARAGQIFKFFAGEALRQPGDFINSVRANVEITVGREPVGVVGLITPWNFPIAIPAWKIAPALAFGNAVVFKPSELTPGSAWALADIIHRSGLPAGVFNMVMGNGRGVGAPLVADRRVNAVSFTGSTATGSAVAAACAARGARYQLEMGGKNPLVVLDDADVDLAVECAVNGAFFSTGQRCTASSRLIVTRGIHDRFLDAMTKRLDKIVVGHALQPGVHIGPVVDARQLDKDLSYVRVGREEGARLVTGGQVVDCATPGYFMRPTLFADCSNDMRISREEIFGPVAAMIRADNADEALALANDTEFGLCAGVCTSSLKHAGHFRRNLHAGMVMVNLPTAGVDYHVPFGGQKNSSVGMREQGAYAVDFYTSVKTAYCNDAA